MTVTKRKLLNYIVLNMVIMKRKIAKRIIIFLLILTVLGLSYIQFNSAAANTEKLFQDDENGSDIERLSPYDHIKEENIHVYDDRVILDIDRPVWARFTDTNSMDPIIDMGSNAVQIVPENMSQIHVGDIISYDSEFADGVIIHRVVKIGEDGNGWYVRCQGDNLPFKDPGRIRFKQIRKITVGIVY